MYELQIFGTNAAYSPLIEGGVEWETVRSGSPGKLSFNVVKSPHLDIQKGNAVIFKSEAGDIFFGFIFTLQTSKDELIKVTAYDQLRYLKNKDTYVYTDKTAADVLKMIAANFNLQLGQVDNTGFTIAERIRENQTLFDIVYDAMDLTLMNTNKLFVLYDDFGKLNLRDIENMKITDLVIGDFRAGDYEYKSDIDSDTYNKVKLYENNESTGKRETYIAQHGENMNKWGVLQYFDAVTEGVSPQVKADTILEAKNRPLRTLQVKECLGDIRAKAGFSPLVKLDDLGIHQLMLIEKAKHTFTEGLHTMTLDLRGGI